jgi:predicted dehydrogenase
MALTLAECDRMIDAARRTGQTLMIGQCIRFWPQYELIKQLVDKGRIGAVRCLTLRRLASPPGSFGDWMMDATQSGGALFDLHVHDVDFALHMLGVPADVHARGSRGPSGGIDHVVATYGYADGCYALLEGAWTLTKPYPFEMAITVQGETGTLEWSLSGGPEVLLYGGNEEPERLTVADETGWRRELDYFISCVRTDQPVERCLPASSRQSIALALLERRSIEDGGARLGVANF